MRFLHSLIAATAMLTANAANAEFIGIDDTASDKITVYANNFLIDYLTVNGSVFVNSGSDVSFDFAKGATLNFSGTFLRAGTASDDDETFLFVTAANPTTVVAQLQLNRTAVGNMTQQIDGSYWGIGSGHAFAALGTGTTLTLSPMDFAFLHQSPASAYFDVIDDNLGLIVAAPLVIPPSGTAPVPEPATWAMMICGFAMAGGAMRRRATKAGLSIA